MPLELSNIYFCNQCKKALNELEDLLFVEEGSPKAFCNEECIEKYYTHIVEFFAGKFTKLREEIGLSSEPCQAHVGEADYMSEVINSPDEIWRVENELKEEFFILIKKIEKSKTPFTLFVLAYFFNRRPSFIIFADATTNQNLIDAIKVGELIENPDEILSREDDLLGSLPLDGETIEGLELKKSKFMAEMLEHRLPSDIPIEQFHLYESYLDACVEEPDEIYSEKDDEGDELLTYIKACEKDHISFFYLVICVKIDESISEETGTVVPILHFPTLDGEMYKHFKKGDLVSGNLRS